MTLSKTTKKLARTSRGAQIPEFAAALVLLVMCILIPALDLSVLPIRFFIAQELISSFTRRLALCETLSQSFATVDADPSLQTQLQRIGGVMPKNTQLSLLISQTNGGNRTEVYQPGKISSEWLPNGPAGPCAYVLQLSVTCEISPLVMMTLHGPKIPGLNTPVQFQISATAPWENLGRDPLTTQFFVNE